MLKTNTLEIFYEKNVQWLEGRYNQKYVVKIGKSDQILYSVMGFMWNALVNHIF